METLIEALAKEVKEVSAAQQLYAPEDIFRVISQREQDEPIYERDITLDDVIAAQQL